MSEHRRGKTFVEFPALDEDSGGDMSDEQLFALSARRIVQALLEQIAAEDHALFLRALALAAQVAQHSLHSELCVCQQAGPERQ